MSNQYFIDRQNDFESSARSYPRKFPFALNKAKGCWVEDVEGNRYLDFLCGAGTLALGHNDDEVNKAMIDLLSSGAPLHTLDLTTPVKDRFVEAIFSLLPDELRSNAKIQFCSPSGTDAVDAAIKLCKTATGRGTVIAFSGGYHGMGHGALALTGNHNAKNKVQNLMPGVQFMPYPYSYRCPFGLGGDAGTKAAISYLERMLKDPESGVTKPAALILEPIQGEAGVIVPPKGYLKEVREICDEYGVALIFDEIQTGMGRTGTMWRCEAEGVTPDIMTYGKAFGGGILPITGIICKPSMWVDQLVENPWLLGSTTFGGNPLCCAAAIATIKYMLENDIPGVCKAKGEVLKAGLEKLAAKYPEIIQEVRGTGLMLAVEFHTCELGYETSKGLFARRVMTAGTLVNAKTIRFEPTAVISEQDIKDVISRFDEALADVKAGLTK